MKVLTLTNEQAQVLYLLLSKLKLDSKKNKMRYKFLLVIEDNVFDYEEEMQNINESFRVKGEETTDRTSKIRQLKNEVKELQKKEGEYLFEDREVFSQVRSMFELECGQELEGRIGMVYEEIDQAFIDVKEVNDEK